MHGHPLQRARFTPPHLKIKGEEHNSKMNSIYFPLKCGCLCFVFVTHIQYTTSQHEPKKEPATPPSLLASSNYLALSLFVSATLSFIISSQGFTDVIPFLPLIMSTRFTKTPCDKCVTSTFEIDLARGLFSNRPGCLPGSQLSCDHSLSFNTWQGVNSVRHNSVCIAYLHLDC